MLRINGSMTKNPMKNLIKNFFVTALASLLAFAAASGRAQTPDRTEPVPISMQAQIGNFVQIHCVGPTEIPYTPASGSTKTLKCGDSVTIAGARGNMYYVRTENGSLGYVPASVFPTDPCVQTHFRSAQFRTAWLPKVDSMTNEELWKLKNDLYLKVTADDVAVAYKCLSVSMDQVRILGGIAGFANLLVPNFNMDAPTTLAPNAKSKLMDFAKALDQQAEALNLLTSANTAQTAAYSTRHDELLDRYNSLVDKNTNLINFVHQRLQDLDSASPPATQPDTATWRPILDGVLQGVSSIAPPKHLVCDTKFKASQYGDPLQPDFIYLNGSSYALGDCQEK
jgi:hypothetical protein